MRIFFCRFLGKYAPRKVYIKENGSYTELSYKEFCKRRETDGAYVDKLMISVLSAVAEIERENIRVQTMEGRIQKVREGKWNGGFAPYGYQLVNGKLEINEEEAVAIRTIYDQYVNTDIGANGISKYLENHGIRKSELHIR